ncbi:KNL1 protein, partial [Columbina picui]|nr:KNL1 protein [Columbina picui]
ILKAPRNPLDDLGNGNELTQDINIEKRKKNSRRVSFANTINSVDKTIRKSGTNGVFPFLPPGMSTLLHAPIQALAQQTEWHDVDNGIQRTNRFDTTLIFSDENEMDMTASHTAVITRNQRNNQADETEKIDITSFLAGLNSNREKAETSKGFNFFSDPSDHPCPSFEQKEDATAAKKINFNEFLKSLNSNKKAPSPIEQPEKENVFSVPSQVSEDMARWSVESVYSRALPASCNVTQILGGQDNGMEMTSCQPPAARAALGGGAAPPEPTVFRGDKTVVFSRCDEMEITGNYTDVIYSHSTKEMDNCPISDRQEKTHPMKVAARGLATHAGSEGDSSLGKRVSSAEDFSNPPSATGLQPVENEEPLLARTAEPQSGRAQLPSFLEKSVMFPSGESMDLTGNCVVTAPDHITPEAASENKTLVFALAEDMEITKTHTALVSGKVSGQDRGPADKTIVFAHNQDDMEITASHTAAVNDEILGFENQD